MFEFTALCEGHYQKASISSFSHILYIIYKIPCRFILGTIWIRLLKQCERLPECLMLWYFFLELDIIYRLLIDY